MTGVKSTNISNRVAVSREIVVNGDDGTGLQSFNDMSTQLASTGPVADAIEGARKLQEGASEGYIIGTTWPALAATNGTRGGQPGRVPTTDTGTHSDPVTGDTVPNSGEFVWSVSPAGWRRTGDVIDAAALQAELRDGLTEALGDLFMDDRYAEAIVASDGSTVLIGFSTDGTVEINDTRPLLDGEWAYAEVADDGQTVVRGIRFDGTFFPETAASTEGNGTLAFVAADGNVVIYRNGRRSAITFAGGPYLSPSISGDFATYVEDSGTIVDEHVEEVRAATSLLPNVETLLHHLIYGQSLGFGNSSTPVQTTTAVRAGRAVMFNVGPRSNGEDDQAQPIAADKQYSLVDLREITAETPSSGIGFMLTASGAMSEEEGLLVSVHARGSTVYDNLKKGTGPYANILRSVRRAKVIASLNGLDYDARYVSWIHGETDRDKSEAVYKQYLLELQADLTADLNLLTGKVGDVILVGDQTSNWTAFPEAPALSEVPFAQLKAALENPGRILCVGPKYHLQNAEDGIHHRGPASRRLGCYHGRMIRRHMAGQDTLPLHCAGAARAGAVIRLNMHVPIGPLAIDTTAVTNPGNYGVTWSQTGGSVRAINSVAIDGNDIVVTLNGDPGGISAGEIGIAAVGIGGALGGPTTGPRSNFRDSASDLDAAGVAMPNWACHQKITIN